MTENELCQKIYHDLKRMALDLSKMQEDQYKIQSDMDKLMGDLDVLGNRLTKKMEASYELAKDSR